MALASLRVSWYAARSSRSRRRSAPGGSPTAARSRRSKWNRLAFARLAIASPCRSSSRVLTRRSRYCRRRSGRIDTSRHHAERPGAPLYRVCAFVAPRVEALRRGERREEGRWHGASLARRSGGRWISESPDAQHAGQHRGLNSPRAVSGLLARNAHIRRVSLLVLVPASSGSPPWSRASRRGSQQCGAGPAGTRPAHSRDGAGHTQPPLHERRAEVLPFALFRTVTLTPPQISPRRRLQPALRYLR